MHSYAFLCIPTNPYAPLCISLNPLLLGAGKGVGEGTSSCGGSKIEVQHAINKGKGKHYVGDRTP